MAIGYIIGHLPFAGQDPSPRTWRRRTYAAGQAQAQALALANLAERRGGMGGSERNVTCRRR